MQNQRSAAIQELTTAVRLRPDSAAVYNTLGTVLEHFLETDAALQSFTRAVALDPGMAEAHVSLALLLAQSGDLAGAAEHLDTAIRLEGTQPSVAVPHYLRGKLALEQRDYPKAMTELEGAVQIRPAYQEAWLLLGAARRATLDDAGAIIAFRRAAELAPRDFNAQYELGSEYLSRAGHRTLWFVSRRLSSSPPKTGELSTSWSELPGKTVTSLAQINMKPGYDGWLARTIKPASVRCRRNKKITRESSLRSRVTSSVQSRSIVPPWIWRLNRMATASTSLWRCAGSTAGTRGYRKCVTSCAATPIMRMLREPSTSRRIRQNGRVTLAHRAVKR